MAAQDILIFRQLPIIDGYVQTPPNLEANKNAITALAALTAIPTATVARLSQGTGYQTGRSFGQQAFLQLPGLYPGQSYTDLLGEDPIALLDSGADVVQTPL